MITNSLPQMLLMIMTGQQPSGDNNLAGATKRLLDKGVKVNVIAIGPSIEPSEVFKMADTKSDYISYTPKYDGLVPSVSDPLALAAQEGKLGVYIELCLRFMND